MPRNNSRLGPQSRRARTTRNKPRHANRCQATPAAVWMDVCAPGSEPSPCGLRNSRCPDGRVCARRVPNPCRLRTAAVGMDDCEPGSVPSPCRLRNSRRPDGRVRARRVPTPARYSRRPDGRVCALQRRPAHATQSTTHGASAPLNRSQVAQDTAHAAQHTKRAHR